MKIYFYCKSYQAFFMALKLRNKNEQIVVLTPTKDIQKTCELLKIEYIDILHLSALKILKHPIKTTTNFTQLIKIIKNGTLHFTHTQFDVYCFLLVKLFSKNGGKIVFYNFEFVYEIVKRFEFSKRFIYLFVIKTLLNIFFSLGLVIKKTNSTFLLGIDDEFFNINNINIVDNKNEYYKITLKVIKESQIKLKPFRNLFISQNLRKSNLFEVKRIKEIEHFINKNRIHVKLHPYMNEVDHFEKCEKLPEYLPVELLFSNITKAVISVHSAALITASNCSNLKAISLLNIIGVKGEFLKRIRKDLDRKSDSKILFPRSLAELEKLI